MIPCVSDRPAGVIIKKAKDRQEVNLFHHLLIFTNKLLKLLLNPCQPDAYCFYSHTHGVGNFFVGFILKSEQDDCLFHFVQP